MAKKIMIVDDERDIVEFCGRVLSKEGFEVLTATNGKDCLIFAEKEHPDLILLDINMPEMDGGDIANILSLNQKTKDIPIVFLSGMVTKDEEQLIGGRLFISKLSSKEEILKKIKKALGISS